MTLTTYTDIQIRVRALNKATGAYPVEATLDNGSHFPNGELRLDRQALLMAESEPEKYGLSLFDSLFSGPIRRAYDTITGRAQVETDGHVRVRLWLDRDAAELHALPWERLFHLHRGQAVPLSTSALTPFSRYTGLEVPDSQPITQRPTHLLFAIANPSNLPAGLTPIPVEEEVKNLRQALGDLRRRGEIRITLLPGRSGLPLELQAQLDEEGYVIADGVTSLDNILRLLPGCHVLHFLGHGHFRREGQRGEGTAALHLEKADGAWAAVGDEELVGKLANVDPQPHLVFLAACESARREADAQNAFVGLGPKLVQAGVPAVVAMQDLVPMDLARQLTGDFYRQLLEHGVVDRALNEARNLLLQPDQVEWAIPVLFMRLRDGRLFEPAGPDAAREISHDYEPEMVYVPHGSLRVGRDPGPRVPDEETPAAAVELNAYYIGKYPVTNAEYLHFVRATGRPVANESGWTLALVGQEPSRGQENHPVVGITWDDAVAYCNWLKETTGRSYRLPSEAEWEYAARGSDGRLFPWGNDFDMTRCNARPAGIGATTPVGRFSPAGDSPRHCADMAGNVWEWTNTQWGRKAAVAEYPYPYKLDDGRENRAALAPFRELRICRGGSFADSAERVACTTRARYDAGSRHARRGFRVAMDA